MDTLDDLLNDLNALAADLGTETKPVDQVDGGSNSSSSPGGSNTTGDTGFDSCSDYNFSTVKRAPPKTPQVPVKPALPKSKPKPPQTLENDFGLGEIMATLDQLHAGDERRGKLPYSNTCSTI